MKNFKERKFVETFGRKKIVIALIILIVVLMITTVDLLIKALEQNQDKVETIIYTENSKVGYNVFLNENDFFEGESLGEGKQYIATLIKDVKANLKYELKSSEPNIKHDYKYKIVADINVKNDKNQNSIYKFSEELVTEKSSQFNTNKKLSISENITVDYNRYNNIIKKFIEVYNLDSITSTVTVNMYVYVDGVTKSANTPVASLVVPLTTKTVAIDIGKNNVNATEISVYKEIANRNYLYISILTFILTIMIIIELYIFTKDTKDEVSMYKSKIKKIMLNYGSYLQKINSDFDADGYQKIEMATFEDLLQVRDTISQPILMKENEKKNETDIFITSGNVMYTYKIKVENPKKNKTKNNKTNKEGLKV